MNKLGATAVAGAQVSFAAVGLTTTSDSGGNFRLDKVPGGLQSIQIRRVGFAELNDTVTVVANREITRVYSLRVLVPTLDTMRSQSRRETYISPALRSFEERRLSKSGGHFIADSIFRANESTTLGNILSTRMPGMTFSYFSEHRLAVSSRKACRGPVLLHACSSKPDCFVAIYLDGQLFFNAKMAGQLPPNAWPDMDVTFPPNTLAGAEYYASSATAPIDMQVDDDGCGSLWLWTREK